MKREEERKQGSMEGSKEEREGGKMVRKTILIIIHISQGWSLSVLWNQSGILQTLGIPLPLEGPNLWRRWDETGCLSLTPLNM